MSSKSLELLSRLVRFNTVSRLTNEPCITWIDNYLKGLGYATTLYWDAGDVRKANLFATIGPDPKVTPGIILSGHTDVVPVDGQEWDTDPFDLVHASDRVYGRGTCDMKGFIAVCLAAAPKIAEAKLKMPIHFAFSYDEEVGCKGVISLVEDLEKNLHPKPRFCIVGEPTNMKVIIGHKGNMTFAGKVKGFACHSSLTHQGVNAVEVAADIVSNIRSIRKRIEKEGPFDNMFEPPYTSINTGLFHGGIAKNIVPESCKFSVELRNVPQQNPSDIFVEVKEYANTLLPEMHSVRPETGIEWEEVASTVGLDTPENEEVVALAKKFALASVDSEESKKVVSTTGKVSFATEGGRFSRIGIPTVVCGPGSIEQAHKPNEFVLLDQLLSCERFIDQVIGFACEE